MTVRISHVFFSIMLATVVASATLAQEDVRGVKLRDEGLKVIEEKCLVCHNQQRIDAAIKERREVEQILRRMGKKGVFLTERERQVMSHFWGQKVFKTKE